MPECFQWNGRDKKWTVVEEEMRIDKVETVVMMHFSGQSF